MTIETKQPKLNPLMVPPNLFGKPVDLQKAITEKTIEEAVFTFRSARLRLLSPDNWAHLPEFTGASFKLIKSSVAAESTLMELNDFLRIELPGPGPSAGDGFDWVTVENVLQQFDANMEESFGITLRACPNPFNESQQVAAHFFKKEATSTFIVMRSGKTVTVSYHGRNELLNLKGNTLRDQLRNSIVAFGALAGLSALQWSILLKSLLGAATEKRKGHNDNG